MINLIIKILQHIKDSCYQLSDTGIYDLLIDWCLKPALAVFQLYRGMPEFMKNVVFYKRYSSKIHITCSSLMHKSMVEKTGLKSDEYCEA